MAYKPIFVVADNLANAWVQALKEVMKNGVERFIQAPEYQCKQKEAPVFIHVSNALAEPRIHDKAPVQKGQAEEYAKNVIHGMGDKEKENSFDYTYFARLRFYPDCQVRADWPNIVEEHELEEVKQKLCGGKCIVRTYDQVKLAIDTLKRDPTRRSIVLTTWIVARDSIKFGPKREKTSSPCIAYIQPQLIEGKLHLFVVMKTNDLYNAFPLNAFAMTELQRYMASQLNCEVGSYNHFCSSMNIYEDVYELVEELIRTQ